MKQIKNKILYYTKRIMELICSPIWRELPFFLCCIYCLGVRGLYEHTIADDTITIEESLQWLSTLFVVAYFFTVPITFIRFRLFKVIAYLIVTFVYALDLFLMKNFGVGISPSIITAIIETNASESYSFATTFLWTETSRKCYLDVLLIFLFFAAFEWFYSGKRPFFKQIWKSSLAVICVIFMIIWSWSSFSTQYNELLDSQSIDEVSIWELTTFHEDMPMSNVLYAYTALRIASHDTEKCIKHTKDLSHQTITIASDDTLTIVLVIGESYVKWHADLYGYELETTPFMSKERKEGRLFVFNDVKTMSTFTSTVMRNILCCNQCSAGEKWYDTPFFPAIFKQAGYSVFFWDNQKDFYKDASYSFALNSLLYNLDIQDLSYTEVNQEVFPYDGQLIDSYIESPPTHGKHNLSIFHLMGQHFNSKYRFPYDENHKHFTIDSIHRNDPWLTPEIIQNIADYDNATLYNDSVINRLFDYYRDKNAILIYFSDHGEEVYDYRDIIGRNGDNIGSPEHTKYEIEVPFVIWCSDSFIKKYPKEVERIGSVVDIPYEIDLICHLLFDIGSINTTYYNATLDILSPNYKHE